MSDKSEIVLFWKNPILEILVTVEDVSWGLWWFNEGVWEEIGWHWEIDQNVREDSLEKFEKIQLIKNLLFWFRKRNYLQTDKINISNQLLIADFTFLDAFNNGRIKPDLFLLLQILQDIHPSAQ